MTKLVLALVTASAVVSGSTADAAAPTPAACPPTTVFTSALDHLEGYRVSIGADGDSTVKPYRVDARQVPMLKTGKILKLLMLPRPGTRNPEIVVGPGDVDVPLHPAPYREMFILLGGSYSFRTAKESHAMKAGSVLLYDDVGAVHGHGGKIGPCGYIALSIAP